MKILLLEDDVILNEIIEEFLLSLNYEVITAFDGNIAEELIYEESFDLLLFDVNIPNITGFELLKNIRQNNIITPLTNNLKSQLAYCTFGCLKKLATF